MFIKIPIYGFPTLLVNVAFFHGFPIVFIKHPFMDFYTVNEAFFHGFSIVFIKIPIYGFPTLFVNVHILLVSYSVYQNTHYTVCQCSMKRILLVLHNSIFSQKGKRDAAKMFSIHFEI